MHGEDIVPKQRKALLKSGKLSVKDMPVGKFNELYQDYVCSCVLGTARDVLALLPVDVVIVSALARGRKRENQTAGGKTMKHAMENKLKQIPDEKLREVAGGVEEERQNPDDEQTGNQQEWNIIWMGGW